MAIVYFDLGMDQLLKMLLNNYRPAVGNDLTIHLYTNNITLVDTLSAASFTEADGGGYVSKTLTCGNWTVNPDLDPTTGAYAKQIWTFSGALSPSTPTIYGYIVKDKDGVALWGEALPAPFTPGNNGDHVDVTPKIQGSKGTPT